MTQEWPSQGEGYQWLLDEVAVIAADHDQESELGAAAFATHAVLATLPTDARQAVRLARWTRAFGGVQPSMFRRTHADDYGVGAFGRDRILHEGYRVDPQGEGATEIEQLRACWGIRLLATSPQVWASWGSKGSFRRHARTVLGECAVPSGIETTVDLTSEWQCFVDTVGGAPQRRVVKFSGTGGAGNLVLDPGHRLSATAEAVQVPEVAGPVDVVVENWMDWKVSLSVSFLLLPWADPLLLDVAEQFIDTRYAKFVGSTNRRCLSPADNAEVCARIRQLADAMVEDGVVGVSAVDVIVGEGWGDLGLALPSGLRMCLIECNPRFNRHNRVGLLVERLGRAWGLASEQLTWTLRDIPYHGEAEGESATLRLRRPTPGEPVTLELADRDRTMVLTVSKQW